MMGAKGQADESSGPAEPSHPHQKAEDMTAPETFTVSSKRPLTTGRRPDRTGVRAKAVVPLRSVLHSPMGKFPIGRLAHKTDQPLPAVGTCAGCQRVGRSLLRKPRLAETFVPLRDDIGGVVLKPFDGEARIDTKGFGDERLRLVHLARKRVGGGEI